MTRTTKIVWIAAIVVVILIVIASFLNLRRHRAVTPPAATPLTDIQPTYAPNGQLAPTFPKDILLGARPEITQSYSVPYGTQNQSTTSFQVQDNPDALFQAYITYFQSNSYGIISKQQTKTLDSIYASNKGADISVTITQVTGGSRADVSYLKK
jgi:hypothetical protein